MSSLENLDHVAEHHLSRRGMVVESAEILKVAREIHDKEGCRCDPKYLRSCATFTNAIFKAAKQLREEGKQ